jgi:hypothetical protein
MPGYFLDVNKKNKAPKHFRGDGGRIRMNLENINVTL